MKPWAELPVSAQVKRIRRALDNVLPAWGLGNAELRFIFHGENTTFRATGAAGSVLVRAHRAGYNTPEQTRSELAWVEAVHRDTGLASRPLTTREGSFIAQLKVPSVPMSHVSVLEWQEGKVLGTHFGDETVREMGEIVARLHEHAVQWRRPTWFSRPKFGFGEEFTDANPSWLLLPERHRRFVAEFKDDAARAFKALVGRGETGLLHSDLHGRNMLRTPRGLRVIDFDDCGFRPWVQDIAVACAFWDRRQPERLAALLQGYHRVRDLPSRHLDGLPLFVAARLAGVALWVTGRAQENARFRSDLRKNQDRLFKRAREALARQYS
jgi:Ser/Thr protein kinase RdoA (MazF antagonist)